MDKRAFSIVFGYLPGIDKTYRPAKKVGLKKRYAIVLDSYRPSLGEMYFDVALFFDILKATVRYIDYDELIVEHAGKKQRITSATELKTELGTKLGVEDEYPDQMLFQKNGNTVCIVNREPYHALGGPPPYSDSYTFSFYTNGYNQQVLVDALSMLAQHNSYTLDNVYTGIDEPQIRFINKKRVVSVSVFFAVVLIIVSYLYGIFTPYNYFTARLHLMRGKPSILQYGEREESDLQAVATAPTFGFHYRIVAGCTVSPLQVNGIDAYNAVMSRYLDNKIGKNWKQQFHARVDSSYRIKR